MDQDDGANRDAQDSGLERRVRYPTLRVAQIKVGAPRPGMQVFLGMRGRWRGATEYRQPAFLVGSHDDALEYGWWWSVVLGPLGGVVNKVEREESVAKIDSTASVLIK